MSDPLLEKIKKGAHWKVVIRPSEFEVAKIPEINTCEEMVASASVEFRGWDYPHVPQGKTTVGNDYVEGRVDWSSGWMTFQEIWRFYQSEQFVHFFALHEDNYDLNSAKGQYYLPPDATKFLSVTSTVYQFTEVFEFLSRLAKQGAYKNGGEIKISLSGTKGRVLASDRGRTPLFGTYASGIEEINFVKRFSHEDATERSAEMALDGIVYLFNRFNWKNLPIAVFKNDQQKLIERRIW